MTNQDPSQIAPDSDAVLVPIILRDTQQLTLDGMIGNLKKNGFFKAFPPDGVEVVSWYQLMSFGHLVTLKVPPAKVREVNRALESSSYTTFKSEVYLGYDFWPIIESTRERQGLSPAATARNPLPLTLDEDAVLVTTFLKHTQNLTLEEMGENLRKNGFFESFPPDGVEVVSGYQLMSFGHVVTLKVPPAKVREVNRALESGSYTTFKSEVYLGYDFWPVMQSITGRDG
jgi:hypothetical protein